MATASSGGGGPTLLLHYDGMAWAPVAIPDWTNQRVDLFETAFPVSLGVLRFFATQGYSTSAGSLFEQYAGGQWRQVAWPYGDVNGYPLRLVAVSSGELWGIATIRHEEGCAPALVTSIPQGVFLHYQQGTWSRDVLP